MKKIILILGGISLLLGVTIYILYQNYEYQNEEVEDIVKSDFEEETNSSEEEEKDEKEKVIVDIKGMVAHPGIYEVDKNSRVNDVISLAGGLLDGADTSLINLAKLVEDEMTIIVYSTSQVEEKYKEEVCTCDCSYITNDACIISKEDNKQININTASLEKLQEIPGIGLSKAKAIIAYREKTPFTSIEDIKNVSGIGDNLFEQIKDYLIV